MGVGLSPLPLAAARLPPPPLAGPGLCSVGRRGSLAYGSPPRPPGLIRARRSACGWPACCALRFAPARGPPLRSSRSVVGRPPAGALSRPRLRRGLPPPSSALWSFLRSGGLASSQVCAWGGRGCPPAGPCSARRFPARVSSGPPCAPPCSGAPGALWWSGLLPCRPPPGRPRWGLPGAQGPFGWGFAPPPASRSAPPEGRASRAPLRRPAPVGAGPRGPLSSPVVNPEIVNPDCYTVRVVPPAGSPIVAPRVKTKPLRGGFASLDPLRYGTYCPGGLDILARSWYIGLPGPVPLPSGGRRSRGVHGTAKAPTREIGWGFFHALGPSQPCRK